MSVAAPVLLRGITWNHSRGLLPLLATAQRFSELNQNVEVVWQKRSLQAFADQRLDELAAQFDLIVLDHPWTGALARTRLTLPLDDSLSPEYLTDQAANSVGSSHQSYQFDGRQWALAIDAATPVASWRPDLLSTNELPQNWAELIDLASSGRVLMPGIPLDSLMNFYMLCSSLGEDVCQTSLRVVSPEIGIQALQMLHDLASHIHSDFWQINPIGVYELLTRTDRFVYCPFAYGYSNYARLGYADKVLSFGEMVRVGDVPMRSTLGGTGLAVAARCEHQVQALKYAAFVASRNTQRTLYVDNGGQPAHRLAWMDDHANSVTNNYFRQTLPALDRAFLRPRNAGSMYFQDHAGAFVQRHMREGGNEREVLRQLDNLYFQSLSRSNFNDWDRIL